MRMSHLARCLLSPPHRAPDAQLHCMQLLAVSTACTAHCLLSEQVPSPACTWVEFTFGGTGAVQLAAPSPAWAVREVELPDGGPPVEAYEFDIELRAVALRGAVASDAKLDFQRALRRHARFKLEQRAQLADIYAELGNPRCASPTIAWHKAAQRQNLWLVLLCGSLQPVRPLCW